MDDPELFTTDEELNQAYQKFMLRAIKKANELGLQGKLITELQWREDIPTGRQLLRFKTDA